jgi:enediyne biosynthesis protein E7
MATLPPGPKGEYWGPLNYQSWRADMFGFLTALTHGYGDVVGFDLGRSPCILVNGALQVRELFVEREECLRKPQFVKDSNCGHWGDGLTTLEGSLWRSRRRLLQASLRVSPSPPVLAVVVQCTKGMLDSWPTDGKADLTRELRILTARIALRTVLDAELEGYGPSEDRSGAVPFVEAYGEEYLSVPGGDPTAPLVMKRPRAPHRMDETIRIIDERIVSGAERGDVLSSLVRARLPDGTPLTRDEILGEVIQMLYAGHLTIPSSLVNFWRDIAAADIAARLAGEAEVLCQSGTVDFAAIAESYCIAALKESMRLHPPAPILYREVEKAFELDGFDFARDVAVWVSPQLLHNDARYFPEPARFLPERFMKESLTVKSGSPYFPFGAGQRVCIASRLALQQMALICLLMARKFELLSTENVSKNFHLRRRKWDNC